MYGEPYRIYNLPEREMELVLNGEVYHGIAEYPWHLFIIGFFSNELKNSVGVPIEINGETNALFIRPDTNHQFGEMRLFLAVMLVLSILFSFLLEITASHQTDDLYQVE